MPLMTTCVFKVILYIVQKARDLIVWNAFGINYRFYQSHVTASQRKEPSKSTRQKQKVPILKSAKNKNRQNTETFEYQKQGLLNNSPENISLYIYLH